MKQYQLTIPAITYAGQGSIEKITEIIEREQVRSILIFTDKGVRESGLTKRIEELCSKYSYTVIDDLASEP